MATLSSSHTHMQAFAHATSLATAALTLTQVFPSHLPKSSHLYSQFSYLVIRDLLIHMPLAHVKVDSPVILLNLNAFLISGVRLDSSICICTLVCFASLFNIFISPLKIPYNVLRSWSHTPSFFPHLPLLFYPPTLHLLSPLSRPIYVTQIFLDVRLSNGSRSAYQGI